jgi:hypothetical protein
LDAALHLLHEPAIEVLREVKVFERDSEGITGCIMKEIRLCWSVDGRKNQAGEPIDGGLWHPDTPEARRDLEFVAQAGNEAYGMDTHWIEVREA